MADLVVYGSRMSPFVRKVETVLHEKQLDYDFEEVSIADLPDWYLEIHPLRRIPVLRDITVGASGVLGTIPDSSAICGYLERKAAPNLIPDDPYEAGRVLWFEEYADAEMAVRIGFGIFRAIAFPRFSGGESELDVARKTYAEKIPRIFDYLEQSLDGSTYLVGSKLTLADIAVACQISQMHLVAGPVDATRWPVLADHYQRMSQLKGLAHNFAICSNLIAAVLPEKVSLYGS